MSNSKQVTPSINPSISSRINDLAAQIGNRRAALLREKNLSPGQDDFLLALLATDGVTMGTLAETLAISASSATKAAIKLEAADLVRREASRIDNRQNYAHLTPLGRETAREIIDAYDQLDKAFFVKLKGKDGERLLKILDRLENDGKPVGKNPRKAGSKKKKAAKAKKSGNK